MAVTLQWAMTATSTEVLTGNVVAAASNAVKTVTHAGYNGGATLTSVTTPPVTKNAYFLKAMSAGAGTIDLRALTGTNDQAVDLNGLKVQVAMFKNPSTNANSITIVGGASNGYLLFGTAGSVVLAPGQAVMFYGHDALPDVDATHKTLDISGTLAQTLECSIVAG